MNEQGNEGQEKMDRRGRWTDFRAMWNATRGLCPNCGEAEVFTSFWGVGDTCPNCGVRFERESGAWLGAWVMAYTVAIVLIAIETGALILAFGLFQGLEWVLVASGILFVVLLYRPVKGWWLWWMWAAGFVHRDGEDENAPR